MKKQHSLFALFVAAALSFGAVGSFVAINALAEHPAGSQVNGWANPTSTEGSYYEQARGLSGSDLKAKLKTIIGSNISVSYDWTRFEACDEAEDDSNYVLCLYSRKKELKTAHVSSAVGWNREHSFPQSKMTSTQAKSDDHIIFASDNKVNGARSNYKLGNVSHTGATAIVDSYGATTECYLVDSVFEPSPDARGEVARASLYAATLYDFDLAENFTSQDVCLNWHASYPVSDREIYRNNTNYTNQKNRNPFIDHPEFATMIWDSSYSGAGALNDTTLTSSSSAAASTSYVSSSSSSSSSSTSQATSSSVVSSSSSSSISGDSVTITGSSTNMPTSYPSATSYTIEGLNLILNSVATFDSGSTIQFKASSSYMTNSAALSKSISSIVITVSYGSAPTVTYGSTSSLGSTATSTSSGSVYTYTLGSDATYFKIANTSSYAKYTSIVINFASSASVAVTGVSLSASTASVAVGSTTNLTATVSPSDATNKNVTWSSSNTSVATVSGGVVSGVAAGNATITVTTADGSITDTCVVTVSNVVATSVALSDSAATLAINGTKQLTVTFTPSNTTDQSGTWTSSNSTVASVSSSGLVTALAAGSATITFTSTSGSRTDTCAVTVAEAVVLSSIKVTGATASATFGSTYSTSGLVVTATYSDGTTKNVTASSEISTPNTKVIGPQTPSVSYTEDSVTKMATYAVDVTTVGAIQGDSATVYNGSIVPNATVNNGTDISSDGAFSATGVTLSSFAATATYGDGSSTQYRVGSKSNAGDITFTLSSTVYLKSVILNVAQYSTESATAYVTDGTTTASGAISSSTTSLNFSSNWASNTTGTTSIKVYNNAGKSRFYFTGVTFTYTTTAASVQNFTDAEEATAWATYFTTCTQGNCHGSTIWDTVSAQYAGMSDTAKAYFVAHESSDTTIKAAYDRYTFARAQYGLTDFIGGSSGSAASLAASNNASYWALGAVLSVFALTTIGYISFSFKKKHQ